MAESPKLWTPLYAGILLVNVFTFMVMYMQIAVFPAYLAELSGNRSLAGFATGVYTGAALLLRPTAGWFLDRRGRRAALAIGAVALAASLALYFPLSGSVVPFLALRAASGAAFCFLSTAAGALVADSAPPSRLGEGVGFFALSTVLGTALGPVLGLALAAKGGTAAFLSGSLAVGVSGAALALLLPLRLPAASPPRSPGTAAASAERVGALRFAPSLCLFLVAVALGFILSFIQAAGAERAVSGVGRFFTFYSLSVLAVRLAGARLMDRADAAVLAYASLASLALCFAVLALADSYAAFMAAACLFGAGVGVLQPLLNALQLRFVPARMRGTASAAYFAAMDLGVTVGSIALGLALPGVGFGGMFAALAALMLAAAAAFHLLIRPSARSARP